LVPWFADDSGACFRLAAMALLLLIPPDKGALGDLEPGGDAGEADAFTAHSHESVPGVHGVHIREITHQDRNDLAECGRRSGDGLHEISLVVAVSSEISPA
jgi:hypothetical protein